MFLHEAKRKNYSKLWIVCKLTKLKQLRGNQIICLKISNSYEKLY